MGGGLPIPSPATAMPHVTVASYLLVTMSECSLSNNVGRTISQFHGLVSVRAGSHDQKAITAKPAYKLAGKKRTGQKSAEAASILHHHHRTHSGS